MKLQGSCPEARGTEVSAVGLWVGYITARLPGPHIQPGPSTTAASAASAICLRGFPLIDEAAQQPKAKASALW